MLKLVGSRKGVKLVTTNYFTRCKGLAQGVIIFNSFTGCTKFEIVSCKYFKMGKTCNNNI